MARLWAHEPSSKEELTEALWAEAPTVAKMLTRMEAAGLIERERPQDRRVLLVALTDKGRALCEPVTRSWTTQEEATAKDLSPAERE